MQLQDVGEFSFTVHTIAGVSYLTLTHPDSLPFKAGIIVGVASDLAGGIPMLCLLKCGVMFPGNDSIRPVSVPGNYSGIRAVPGSPVPQQTAAIAFMSSNPCSCVLLLMCCPLPAFAAI